MRLTLAVLAALLFFAAPARAAGPEIGIADDRVLLNGGAEADAAVKEWTEHRHPDGAHLRAVVTDRTELAQRRERLGANSTTPSTA